ncbi:tetratricopeptide repeat protein [Fundidesulfovibrio terrae]|uniref:tetratricopeptide repeat protein n=1 Tax=Fundidesulfovibrio terrae TaxID=2922866 RepID=UPI001FAE88FB|nr:tetratricopeptide repeat protein [Fundidesulfovibrio terrae]
MMLQGKNLTEQGNFKGAIVVFKNLLEKYPNDLEASFALTDALIHVGKYQQAEAQLVQIAKLAPGNVRIAVLTAKAGLPQKKLDQALEILKPVLESPDAPAEAWEQAGHATAMKGDLPLAQQYYEKALALSGDLVSARFGLAECHLLQHQYDQAQQDLLALLKIDPKNQTGLHMLAQVHIQNNDVDAAIETYSKLAQLYPQDIKARYREAYFRLLSKNDIQFAQSVVDSFNKEDSSKNTVERMKLQGLVALANKDPKGAIDTLLQTLKIRTEIDTLIYLAQAYSSLGNFETAITHLQTALSINSSMELPRRMLAAIYLKQNRLDEAIAETQKLFDNAPDDTAGQRIMAEALIGKHEYGKSLEMFSQLAEKDGSPAVLLKRGMLLSMKGDDAAAEADLRKAVELGGNSLEPRIYLSSFLAGKKRVNEAITALDTGATEGPEAALSFNAKAKLYLRQNDRAKAVELLESAKRADPSVLVTYYNLAALRIAAGETAKAAAEFEAALAISPDDQSALAGAAGCFEALGDMAKTQALLERAAKNKNPRASLALAGFFIRRDDKAKALAILDDSLASFPKEVQTWMMKSRLHALMGDQEKALAALARLETINLGQGYMEKARYYLSRQNPDKAIETAAKFREMNPRSGDYALPLAEIQEIAGRRDDARATLQSALRDDPSNYKVFAAMARIESGADKPDEALALLDKAIAAGMDPSQGYSAKGQILQHKGDIKGAQQQYEKALRIQSRQPMTLNNLAMIYADNDGSAPAALELAIRAYAMDSGNPMVLDTLGYALLKNDRTKEAVAALEQAQKMLPGNADITNHLNMARELDNTKK